MTKLVGMKMYADCPLCTTVCADNEVLLTVEEYLHKKEFLF
jgi:hypothetical protein